MWGGAVQINAREIGNATVVIKYYNSLENFYYTAIVNYRITVDAYNNRYFGHTCYWNTHPKGLTTN